MNSWLDFWSSPHRIYVNERHREIHYRRVADAIVALVPNRDAVVLDYGPGEALHADRIAGACGRLILCEAAEATRARLKARFTRNPEIAVVAPADLQSERAASVDLFLVNSVVQYLSPDEFAGLLSEARRLLVPDGRLVVADVIPPHAGLASDTAALLSFAAREGFLVAAIAGLLATLFSPYRKIRRRLGLARFEEAEMLEHLARAGFSAHRTVPNLGHDQARLTFVARPR